MKRPGVISILAAVGLLLCVLSLGAQTPATKAMHETRAAVKKEAGKSKEWKMQNAMSAAPQAVAKNATIVDYPEKEGAESPVLRKGSNEWTCFPDDPKTPGNDPRCLDKMALLWAQAHRAKKEPKLASPGIGYMLQGGSSASNDDPFATKPPVGKSWMKERPHVMVFPTEKLDPKVYSSDPHSGGPWIMFGRTPYEHLMVPVK
jgi:hypothetical protein